MICTLCPRRCGAERDGRTGAGWCRMPALPVVARAALHRWKEPPISGSNGSGAVFFSGCCLGCVYCQNEKISREGFGLPVTPARLEEICRELISQGAHNINFVSPTHFAHVLSRLLERPLGVPAVYNTGGYDRVETLRALEGKIDIYLPDLKYLDPEAAGAWFGAADYPQVAAAAILEMARQTGPCRFGPDGLLKRGVIIRHLLLPGRLEQAKAVMDWVAAHFSPGQVLFSLMSQYTPCGPAREIPALSRRVRPSEARNARAYMENLGLEGFVQEPCAANSAYIPAFDLTGVIRED
ncbi:MAG: radical SAM protein [Oscillospiraceae bacterium]|nr:radical SAM protein [Oscillospiraceae bacterium]